MLKTLNQFNMLGQVPSQQHFLVLKEFVLNRFSSLMVGHDAMHCFDKDIGAKMV